MKSVTVRALYMVTDRDSKQMSLEAWLKDKKEHVISHDDCKDCKETTECGSNDLSQVFHQNMPLNSGFQDSLLW